jgi:hypothetical protein
MMELLWKTCWVVLAVAIGPTPDEMPAAQAFPTAASRDPAAEQQRRKKEEQIHEALAEPISVAFRQTPLRQALEDLRLVSGIPICLDKEEMQQAGIDPETPVSLRVRNLSVKSVLNLLVKQAHLRYTVSDEGVKVTRLFSCQPPASAQAAYALRSGTPAPGSRLNEGADSEPVQEKGRTVALVLKLVEVGSDGQEKIVCRLELSGQLGVPMRVFQGQTLMVQEGSIRDLLKGPCSPAEAAAAEQLLLGADLVAVVTRPRDDRLRLDLCWQQTELEEADRTGILVIGTSCHLVRTVKPGKTVEMVFQRDEAGAPRRWLEVTVQQLGSHKATALGQTP